MKNAFPRDYYSKLYKMNILSRHKDIHVKIVQQLYKLLRNYYINYFAIQSYPSRTWHKKLVF